MQHVYLLLDKSYGTQNRWAKSSFQVTFTYYLEWLQRNVTNWVETGLYYDGYENDENKDTDDDDGF